jgi:hypothetical protein
MAAAIRPFSTHLLGLAPRGLDVVEPAIQNAPEGFVGERYPPLRRLVHQTGRGLLGIALGPSHRRCCIPVWRRVAGSRRSDTLTGQTPVDRSRGLACRDFGGSIMDRVMGKPVLRNAKVLLERCESGRIGLTANQQQAGHLTLPNPLSRL